MRSLFPVILMLSLFFTCKKKMFDYRNKYVGEYSFSGYTYTIGRISGNSDTTYFENIDGELSYDKKGEKGTMNLFVENLIFKEFTIDKSGNINLCLSKTTIDNDYTFEITYDKIICDDGSPAMGGKEMYTITGKKK